MAEAYTIQQLIYTPIRNAAGLIEQLTGIKTSVFSSPELAIETVEKRRNQKNQKKDPWNLETWVEKKVATSDGTTPSEIIIKSWEVTTINSRIVIIIARNKVDADPFEK